MNKQQKEVCIVLIDNAKTKKEVLDAMIANYKDIRPLVLQSFIDNHWELGSKKETISLRGLNYSERHKVLEDLLKRKDEWEIKKITLVLIRHREKIIPNKFYNTIITKTDSKREKLKGARVELLRNKTGIIYEVRRIFEVHDFTIWDISERDLIHIEYPVRPA